MVRSRDVQVDIGSVISGISSFSNLRSEQSFRSFGRGFDVYDIGIFFMVDDWVEIDLNKYDVGILLSFQDWNLLLDILFLVIRGEFDFD